MAQRSITSFFSKPPAGSPKDKEKKSSSTENVKAEKNDSSITEAIENNKEDDSMLSPIKQSSSKGRKNRILASSDEEDIENETLAANKSSPLTPKEHSSKIYSKIEWLPINPKLNPPILQRCG